MLSTDKKKLQQLAIPEIVKAYDADPQTKLAQAAVTEGTSTAPVARGNAGYADGIARVLSAGMGAAIQKHQYQKYQQDQADLIALRQQRGQDGLTGQGPPAQAAPPAAQVAPMPAQAPPPATGGPPPGGAPQGGPPPQMPPGGPPPANAGGGVQMPQASAVAAALNGGAGGPPQGGDQGTPVPFGSAPVPTPMPPAAAPPAAAPPAAASPPTSAPPARPALKPMDPNTLQQPIPDAPPPVDIQAEAAKIAAAAPQAVGPTRSKLLDAAYRIMADGNAYESAQGQDLYAGGLSEQDKLNEAAAEREQRLRDMGFQTAAGMYANGQEADRNSVYADRQRILQNNFTAAQGDKQDTFEASENQKNRNATAAEGSANRANALQIAQLHVAQATGTPEEQAAINKAVADKRLDPMRLTTRNVHIIGQALLANPTLNAIQLHALATLDANPAAQQKAATLAALPTVLGNVRDAGKKLNYSDAQFLGNVQKFAKGQMNDPDFVSYMTQRNDALSTVASVMGNAGASDYRTRLEAEAAHPTLSPRALDGWMSGQLNAIHPRLAIAERNGLIPKGTTATLEQQYGLKPLSAGAGLDPAPGAPHKSPTVSNW